MPGGCLDENCCALCFTNAKYFWNENMKKKESNIAIFVAAKNSGRTINDCLDSLLTLNYTNYKIFVLVADSKDNTWDIVLNKWHQNREKIEAFKMNLNLPQTYNFLIDKVDENKYSYIAFTDADCIVEKDWLNQLINTYNDPNQPIAVAGKVINPKKPDNKLQELIGRELEERYNKFPRFISRAATMNLSVKTEYAKKVRFDERLEVVQETDWGYRLTKLGKMIYTNRAIVRHRHRSTWISFFKQQFRYGEFTPLLYVKHPDRTKGDHVSTSMMMMQPFIFGLGCLFLVASLISSWFIFPSVLLFIFLVGLYFEQIISISKNMNEDMYYFTMFLTRTIAWTFGMFAGVFKLINMMVKE